MCTTQQFLFQYFDQESDFGVEDENGERQRKRKRPGRKPNPPSLQARRAQNREAQKAFREREQLRRKAREEQWLRDSKELAELRRRVAKAEYEAQYLKGYVLHMVEACIRRFGGVPVAWVPRSNMDLDSIPTVLKSILDSEKKHILSLNETSKKYKHKKQRQQQQHPAPSSSVSLHLPQQNEQHHSAQQQEEQSKHQPYQQEQHRGQKEEQHEEPSREEQPEKEQHKEQQQTVSESALSPFLSTQRRMPVLVIDTLSEPPVSRDVKEMENWPPLQAVHMVRMQLKMLNVLGDMSKKVLYPSKFNRKKKPQNGNTRQ
ncbi:hypothetical protein EC973_006730 [Apophysomyces ossiformis]|uniref:BZIP domain-containing protein n=1 Tax=Apophysomyces ossiformis TaxID=679940 RepID=A0A8H7BT15_9FUNG|nr:hypothetical protein EC973_006730 [Apophysomyces ossiformis]